jgi:hypothetical protein
MAMKLKFSVLLACSMLLGQTTVAQRLNLYSSRVVNVGARAAGLADAFVTDTYDVTAMYWNPASLAFLQKSSVVLNHYQESVIHGMNENISFPLQLRKGETVAFGFVVNHVGYLGANKSLEFRAIQYGYDIAYAKEIIPTFSLGGALNVRYALSSASNILGVTSSVGIFYSPSQEISYGAVLSGLGSGISYVSDRTTTSLSSENLPRSLQAGASMRFPATSNATIFTLSVVNEKVFGQDGIRYKGGVEVYLLKIFALRGGYIFESNLGGSARFGLGVRSDRFQLDYSISPNKSTDLAYQLSLAIVYKN